MELSDFDFDLPEELIANFPLKERSACRLLSINTKQQNWSHNTFTDLIDFLNEGDVLVFNDTKVIPARVFGRKESGAKLEFLLERITGEKTFLSHIRASRSPKIDTIVEFGTDKTDKPLKLKIIGRQEDLFEVEIIDFNEHNLSIIDVFFELGHIPLPPYIKRADNAEDFDLYQTVYGINPGAVAAPTAGLHFDETFMQKLTDKGIKFVYVTLHVGAGTFAPIKVDTIEKHIMHSEYLEVSEDAVKQILSAKHNGNKIIAVGTTSVRALETAALHTENHELKPYTGYTDIFIYPGKKFNVIDGLVTNFHLPKSTLIMLVSALAGKDLILSAYKNAIENKYRFFSYGDAMFII